MSKYFLLVFDSMKQFFVTSEAIRRNFDGIILRTRFEPVVTPAAAVACLKSTVRCSPITTLSFVSPGYSTQRDAAVARSPTRTIAAAEGGPTHYSWCGVVSSLYK